MSTPEATCPGVCGLCATGERESAAKLCAWLDLGSPGAHPAIMLPQAAHALSQSDLVLLDAFLHSPACGREAMGLSRAHGFLTAAASGPERLEPAEWLRLVFDEPVFENAAQAERMLGLALRLYGEIETGLGGQGSFRPVLDFLRDEAGGMTVDASAWCQGYFSGMSLCRELWAIYGGRELKDLLAPIFRLSHSAASAGDPGFLKLCDELPFTAAAVYRYWRNLEAEHAF